MEIIETFKSAGYHHLPTAHLRIDEALRESEIRRWGLLEKKVYDASEEVLKYFIHAEVQQIRHEAFRNMPPQKPNLTVHMRGETQEHTLVTLEFNYDLEGFDLKLMEDRFEKCYQALNLVPYSERF